VANQENSLAWRKRKRHTTDEAGAVAAVVEARDAAVAAVQPSHSWK
jgi:hypothetical protein